MIESIESYKLSEKTHNNIYRRIRRNVFANAKPVENPTAIIVGAPSGSGKGSVIGYSKRMFDNDNIVIITTDEYKHFHPQVDKIATRYPEQFIHIVEQESALWTNKILTEAINNKYNFIFECTLKNDRILERIKELKENGFKIIVRGLAVPYLEALLTVHERYILQLKVKKWGRLVTIKNFNEAYENMPITMEKIENSNLCDEIEVYTRGKIQEPIKIYSSKEKNNMNVKQAIIVQRINNEITKEEANTRLNDIENSLNEYEKDKIKEQIDTLKEIIESY